MAGLEKPSDKDLTSGSFESHVGECESFWLLSAPFDQRDYMISPSDSASGGENDQAPAPPKHRKLTPSDIKIDEKYLLDSRKALKKLVDLTRDECATLFVPRLADLVHKFLQGSPPGFFMEDLPSVIEVVEFFSRNRSEVPEFSNLVKTIMFTANDPPRLEKSSDVLHCMDTMVDYFTLFGELLATFEEECFQLQLLQALDCLLTRRKLVDVSCVKLSFCHEAVEASQLPYVVVTLMETVPSNLYIPYVELALQILLVSVKAGLTMIRCNVLDFLLWRMEPFSKEKPPEEPVDDEVELQEHYRLLDKSTYLIWGLLAIISKEDVGVPRPGENALRSLKSVFMRELATSTPKGVDTRNNLAGILVKLCALFGDELPVAEIGLAVVIGNLAVATEIKPKEPWLVEAKLGASKEDYILKKLMLLCCCLLSKNKRVMESFKSEKVIDGLMIMINPKPQTLWLPSQFVVLFGIALRTLSQLAPELPDRFVSYKGNAKLFAAMKILMTKHFDEMFLLKILMAFCALATCKNNGRIIEDIKAQNGVQVLLDIGFYLLDVEFMKVYHQEKLSRIFVVLERLLWNDDKLRETFSDACVTLSVRMLKRILEDSQSDSKWSPNMLVGFGAFLWEAVVWWQASLKSFIERGGVFLILDFIESTYFPVQMFFLGILVDMTDGGETIAHLLTWRGNTGCGILNMMIDIWRKEEYLNKVHRTPEGFIQDLDAPLMTEEQWYLTHQVRDAHMFSPSIAEMVCSVRPRVHALYQFLQRRYFAKTEVGESCYHVQMKTVKPSFQVYIPLIEHYLGLKMGEIWAEVVRDVNYSGIFPTAFDGEMLSTLLDEKNKWAARIKTLQEEIAMGLSSGDGAEEKKLYRLLRSCQLCPALEGLRELDYVARTSFQKFQKEKKQKQIEEVEHSLSDCSLSGNVSFHRTFLNKTNVTCFAGDYIWIQSEKEVRTFEEKLPPISDSDENCGKLGDSDFLD